MHAPSPREREEKAVGDDFRKGVRDGFGAFALDFEARGEGAGFEGVGAQEGVCGGEGHGSEDGLLVALGGGGDGRRFRGGVQGVEFRGQSLRGEQRWVFLLLGGGG